MSAGATPPLSLPADSWLCCWQHTWQTWGQPRHPRWSYPPPSSNLWEGGGDNQEWGGYVGFKDLLPDNVALCLLSDNVAHPYAHQKAWGRAWKSYLWCPLLPASECEPAPSLDEAQPIHDGSQSLPVKGTILPSVPSAWQNQGGLCSGAFNISPSNWPYQTGPVLPSTIQDQSCPQPYKVTDKVCHCFNRLLGCSA